MGVEWDGDRCALSALCTAMAPDVFAIGADSALEVATDCDESQRAAVEEAVQACPTGAIRLVD
jgi:ferredoxin